MYRKNHKILLLILVLLIIGIVAFQLIKIGHDTTITDNSTTVRELIGNDSMGSVEVIKNMGNPNADKKIAYVVGVHPLENDTHTTFLNMMPTVDNLNYCYDVYIIKVKEDFSKYGKLLPDDNPGRATGQILSC